MTNVLDPESALLTGIARLLDVQGAGTWQEDRALYAPDIDWPISIDGQLDRPCLTVGVTNDVPVDRSTTRYSVQVRVRARPGSGRPRVAAVRNVLHGRITPAMPPGIRVTSIALQSRGDLGRRGAWDEHSLNFTVLAARASAWAGGAAY